MPCEADIVIVGAGVIGLAVASEVARQNREVYILERNETFGREASSRNSAVIHTSVLSPRGSWNARLCTEGMSLLYMLCERHGISYRKTGKLLVAVNEPEVARLEALYERRNDGLEMTMLTGREMNQMEPNVKGKAAIFLPQAGILDAYGLMCYFLGKARDGGAQLACKSEVAGIEKIAEGYRITIKEADGCSTLTTRILINCAGFNSDKISAMAGINNYRLYHFKGEYYSIPAGKGRMVDRYLIYPLLRVGGLVGIHTVLDTDGRVRLGPHFYPVEHISYAMDDSNKGIFYDSVKELFPFIAYDDIEPESAGIMSRLYAPDESFREYIIRHEYNRGLPGFINLVGIESPGLTASPAIARYVGNLVDEILKN